MTSTSPPFSTLVEQRLSALGTNAFAAEQAAGLPPDAIRNVIRSQKKDGPSISRAKEICDALGLEFYIGPKRELMGFSDSAEHSDLAAVEALRSGYLPIPWHEALGRKGSAPIAFSRDWLASNEIVPDVLKAVAITEAGLLAGETKNTVALVDTSAAQRGSTGLWCVQEGTSAIVCRLAFHEEMIVLIPRDPSAPVRVVSRPLPLGHKVLGRVVWAGSIYI